MNHITRSGISGKRKEEILSEIQPQTILKIESHIRKAHQLRREKRGTTPRLKSHRTLAGHKQNDGGSLDRRRKAKKKQVIGKEVF